MTDLHERSRFELLYYRQSARLYDGKHALPIWMAVALQKVNPLDRLSMRQNHIIFYDEQGKVFASLPVDSNFFAQVRKYAPETWQNQVSFEEFMYPVAIMLMDRQIKRQLRKVGWPVDDAPLGGRSRGRSSRTRKTRSRSRSR